MKKIVYLLMFITTFLLAGCGKKDQMVDFIPTAIPTQVSSEDAVQSDTAATPTPQVVYVGKTITKYVKLTEYDDVLNIRSAPSTDADIVGFLVHTEKVDVIEIKDGWARFEYNNSICYVNADFLVDDKPELIAPPTPTAAP